MKKALQHIICSVLLVQICSGISTAEPAHITLSPNADVIDAGNVPDLAADRNVYFDEDVVRKGTYIKPARVADWLAGPDHTFCFSAGTAPALEGGQAVLTIYDWRSRPVWQQRFPTPFNQNFKVSVDGQGVYLIVFDLFKSGHHQSRLARSFGAVFPNEEARETWRKRKDFFIGTCVEPARMAWKNYYDHYYLDELGVDETWIRELEMNKRLGVTVMRLGITALRTGQPPISYDKMDQIVDQLATNGFKVSFKLTMSENNRWAVDPKYKNEKDTWKYPPDPDLYVSFLKDYIPRYKDHAVLYEVHNEPDNPAFWKGCVKDYVEMVKNTVKTVKPLAPDVPVVNGGFCFADMKRSREMVKETADLTDVMAWHSHGAFKRYLRDFSELKGFVADSRNPGTKYVQTEAGFCAYSLGKETEQGYTVIQKILYSWAHDNIGYLVWASRAIGGPRVHTPGEDNSANPGWGYIDYWMCPRFLYGTLASLIHWYSDVTFEKILWEKDDVYIYQFTAADKKLIAVFKDTDREYSVTLEHDGTDCIVVDEMGNVEKTDGNRRINIQPQRYLKTIIITNAISIHVSM